jgi:hypothetical protein
MNAHVGISSQIATKIEAINLTELRLDVRQAVAIAKIAEFENQAHRLGHVIAAGLLNRTSAADLLLNVAESNGLVHEHGDDFIQSIIVSGLECK